VMLVYLKGSYELIRQRLAARPGHFMPAGLLESQFAILEEPAPDEQPIVADVGGPANGDRSLDRESAQGASGQFYTASGVAALTEVRDQR